MTPDDLLTPKAAAAIIGIERRQVLNHIKAGRLLAVNLGTDEPHGARYFVKRADAEAFAKIDRKPGPKPLDS
jgi:hypothetical protein